MSEFDELISMLHLPSEYKQQLDVAGMIKVGLRRLDEKNGARVQAPGGCYPIEAISSLGQRGVPRPLPIRLHTRCRLR